jgi:hypothetical protein
MSLLFSALGAACLYATQLLAGLVVWRALDPRARCGASCLGAALLLGPAAIALQMIAYHFVGVPFALPALVLPWWGLGALAWWRRGCVPAEPAHWPWPTRVLAALVALLTVAAAVRGFSVPIHAGDEVNNFALFARVFATHGNLAPARLAALLEPGHVEYPHLVALNQAWFYAWDGERAPWLARGVDVAGLLALLLLVVGALRPGGVATLALGTLIVAATEVHRFAIGFADVRLLATFVLLALEMPRFLPAATERAGSDPRAPWRVACVIGAAALTKNEGLAVGAGAAVCMSWAIWRQRLWAHGVPALLAAGGFLALWPALRRTFGLATPYVDHALGLPLDLLRAQVPAVLGEWARLGWSLELGAFAHWGGLLWLAGLAGLCHWRDRGVRWLALIWGAHLALYTYVLGAALPGDLQALLQTAAPRLLLHTAAWPIAILLRAARLGPARS